MTQVTIMSSLHLKEKFSLAFITDVLDKLRTEQCNLQPRRNFTEIWHNVKVPQHQIKDRYRCFIYTWTFVYSYFSIVFIILCRTWYRTLQIVFEYQLWDL